MGKNKTEFLLNILFGVFSICLIVVGAISFVASLLVPSLPTFQSIELILFGVIIYTIVKLIFTVDKLFENSLASTDKFIEEHEQGNSPQNPDLIISINDETTPEQIEEIKKNHPQIADQLDKLLNGFMDTIGSNSPYAKDIYKMSVQQLQKELEKAVENNEFERAAEIRDLLKKRTT